MIYNEIVTTTNFVKKQARLCAEIDFKFCQDFFMDKRFYDILFCAYMTKPFIAINTELQAATKEQLWRLSLKNDHIANFLYFTHKRYSTVFLEVPTLLFVKLVCDNCRVTGCVTSTVTPLQQYYCIKRVTVEVTHLV